ncbi:MAG: YfhO family protein [Ignavibacteria bacterium]|nr:YfhO family protein [Ignavibacteria bacterium]
MKTKQTEKNKAIEVKSGFYWYIAIGVFLLTTAIFFWEHLFGSAYLWEDFAEYIYPVQTFAAREFAQGRIPLWNPFAFAGMPFLADLQVGFFYPLNRILTLFVGAEGTLPAKMLELSLIIHFFIAQISMFALMKNLKVSLWGAIFSAITYSFSFLLVCHAIHPMIVMHLAWFPLIFMYYHKANSQSSIVSAVISGLLLGMVMLSGHPQMTLFISLFLGVYFIWNLIADIIKKTITSNSIIKYIVASLLPFMIAAGIFQIQYLPSSELAENSRRQEMSFEAASEGSLELPQIITSVVPKFFGYYDASANPKVPFQLKKNTSEGKVITLPYYYYWETAYYFGVGTLILGFVGIIGLMKTNRMVAFLATFSLFALIFAMGSNGFLYYLFHKLPFFSQFRMPARMAFAIAFGFSLIAGLAIDKLRDFNFKQIMLATAFPLLIALLTATGILQSFFSFEESSVSIIQNYGATALFFVVSTFIIIYLASKKRLSISIAAIILALLAFIDLYVAGADFNRSKEDYSKQYQLPEQTLKAFKSNYPDNIFRVNSRIYNPPFMAMKRNQGMISGIELLEGYNPLVLERNVPPLNRNEIHKLFNVRYEIAIDTMRMSPYFAERADRMPRAWLVGSARVVESEKVADFMKNEVIDYSKIAVIEKQPSVNLPNEIDTNFAGVAKITHYSPNSIVVETSCDKPSLLCLSEIYYPSWISKVDGRESEIIRANYCLRSIALPAGKHTVELIAHSDKLVSGMWITLLTLAFSVVLIIVFRKKE